ncbi:hypothetical protein [Tellurirhabdus bombi]|uniref:hypothetical protein n=1 Tax=Tellurirhabdus bombi TaxID=2907205 RepID=UPI001F2184C1|nr:hypothetical protein [Tellurirhabdus bombi]
MKPIELTECAAIEFDQTFMEREFDPEKLTTIEQEGLTVTMGGAEVPGTYRLMKTDEDYIFRMIPQGWDDGFNIYRVKRSTLTESNPQ